MIPIGDITSIPSGVSRTDPGAESCSVRAPLSILKTIKEMQKMIRMYEKQSAFSARQVLAVILALILMSSWTIRSTSWATKTWRCR